jgi:hypothetical protein
MFVIYKLLTIDWFETLYSLLIRFFDFIKDTKIYKNVKVRIKEIKKKIKESLPGEKGFSKELNSVYISLKNIFKSTKAIDEGKDKVEYEFVDTSKDNDKYNETHLKNDENNHN